MSIGPISPNQFYEDTSFVVGDTLTVLDLAGDLAGRADGWFRNDGTGSIGVETSHDGLTYGELVTLRRQEILHFAGLSRVRLTHLGTDSSYRCYAEKSRALA